MKRILLILALLCVPSLTFAQSSLLPYVEGTFTANDGSPLSSGFICATISGTTTNLATYPTAADANARTNPNTNPVSLDSAGRANIWLGIGTYRIVILNARGQGSSTCNSVSTGSAIKTIDGVAGAGLMLTLPSYTEAGLPTPGTPGRIARVTDKCRGIYMDSGTQWVAQNGRICNVQDFGATGNGATDDTSAINAAIAALSADSVAGTVLLPSGTYKTSSCINMAAGVSLLGEGASVDGSVINANATDGICFGYTVGENNQQRIAHLGINGTSGTTFHGIYQAGTDSDSDQLYGVSLEDLLITNFNVAIQAKNTFFWSIHGVSGLNINSGIVLLGQDLDWHIYDCRFVFGVGNGTGASYGLETGYATFNSGMTSVKPEGIQINQSKFFGFTTAAVNFDAVISATLAAGDLESTGIGVRFGEVAAVLTIRDTGIQLNGSASKQCFLGAPQSALNPSAQILINGNACITDGTSSAATGIQIDTNATSNQAHIVISGNNLSTFPSYDIAVYGAGNIDITQNSCYSTGSGTSIYIDSTLVGRQIQIHDNVFLKGNIKAGGSQKAQIIVGANGGTFSTEIYGVSVLTMGTTSGTTTYASLFTANPIPNFDTQSNTGFKIVPTLMNVDGTGQGVVSLSASATGMSFVSASAPGATTTLYWKANMVYPPY